jgi:CheY-like chemotaxis protein
MRPRSAHATIAVVKMRCLVVDDSRRFLRSARATLEAGGARVAVATAALDVPAAIAAFQPDVVLIDVQLGQDSGVEVARRLRSDTSYAGQRPILILISSRDAEDLEALAQSTDADGFIQKSDLSYLAIAALVRNRSSG